MRFAIIALAIMALFSFYPPPPVAAAAGVGASPGELNFEVISEAPITEALTIVNTNGHESSYHVYAEGEYEDWFEISPKEFSLSPKETGEVAVKMLPSSATKGDHTAKICIVSFDPSSDLAVGAGVKVRANIAVPEVFPSSTDETAFPWLPAGLGIVLGLLVILVVLFILLRRRNRYAWQVAKD